MTRASSIRFALTVFAAELGVRLALILSHPTHYSMDAYQRWGGRAHLLVQDWLPATQSIVWGISRLGGGILETRIAMSIVGALAITAGAWCARIIGGPAAGWLFIPIGFFGPILTWTTVPYQEGTFLLFLFGGLALALQAQSTDKPPGDRLWVVADIVFGALALVRYEGWPVTALYILWRRERVALRAVWGMGLWMLIKLADIESHSASPVHYADWEGLTSRFEWDTLATALGRGWTHLIQTHSWLLALGGAASAWLLVKKKRPAVLLLVFVLLGQLAATAGWVVGLEIMTIRMHAVPGVLLGLFISAYIGLQWPARGRGFKGTVVLVAVVASFLFARQGFTNAKRSIASVRYETRLLKKMERCNDCRFIIKPRKGIGTRDRHDGCEIIQGLGHFMHGRDFWCQRWAPVPDTFDATHAARWRKGGYVIRDARRADRQAD